MGVAGAGSRKLPKTCMDCQAVINAIRPVVMHHARPPAKGAAAPEFLCNARGGINSSASMKAAQLNRPSAITGHQSHAAPWQPGVTGQVSASGGLPLTILVILQQQQPESSATLYDAAIAQCCEQQSLRQLLNQAGFCQLRQHWPAGTAAFLEAVCTRLCAEAVAVKKQLDKLERWDHVSRF